MTSTTTAIQIGTRVSCILYWAGRGIVFKIDQNPATVRLPGATVTRPSAATFAVVFDNGHISEGLSESLIRGVQWRVHDEQATAEEIAAALANAACKKAAGKVAAENAAARHAAAVAQLRDDRTHGRLVQADDRYSGKTAAKNIRIELKAAFPRAKFSVHNRDHGSIDVSWIDGPTTKEVEAITTKYQGGHFNGMEDIYEDGKSPWNDVFGGARYVFTHRDFSADLIAQAIGAVFERYAGNFRDSGITATAEDYQRGRLWNVTVPGLGEAMDSVIRAVASETSC